MRAPPARVASAGESENQTQWKKIYVLKKKIEDSLKKRKKMKRLLRKKITLRLWHWMRGRPCKASEIKPLSISVRGRGERRGLECRMNHVGRRKITWSRESAGGVLFYEAT